MRIAASIGEVSRRIITVTKSTTAMMLPCAWCGEPFPRSKGPGRPRRYCRRSHRQRHYEAKALGERRGIGRDEVLISRRVWDSLRDALYRLQTSAEDVAMDLSQGKPTRAGYVEAMAHLTQAVRELQEVSVEPLAVFDEADAGTRP